MVKQLVIARPVLINQECAFYNRDVPVTSICFNFLTSVSRPWCSLRLQFTSVRQYFIRKYYYKEVGTVCHNCVSIFGPVLLFLNRISREQEEFNISFRKKDRYFKMSPSETESGRGLRMFCKCRKSSKRGRIEKNGKEQKHLFLTVCHVKSEDTVK